VNIFPELTSSDDQKSCVPRERGATVRVLHPIHFADREDDFIVNEEVTELMSFLKGKSLVLVKDMALVRGTAERLHRIETSAREEVVDDPESIGAEALLQKIRRRFRGEVCSVGVKEGYRGLLNLVQDSLARAIGDELEV
jgi:hypothetical protein